MRHLRFAAYVLVRGICWLASRIFYRRIEITGLERVPLTGPLLVVGNHGNSAIDPMLMLAFLPRRSRFLAKSTFWESSAWRLIMELAGAIPVYRRQDAGVDTQRNAEMFAATHEVLAAGGVIAMFPEGLSHGEPSLQPLKTGAARIALGAEEQFESLEVRFVPVGLIFEEPHTFRSRVLLRIGEPFGTEETANSGGLDSSKAVRDCTDRLDAALRRVTLNYASWREARLLGLAADLYSQPELELPALSKLSSRFEMRQEFLDRYQELAEAGSPQIDRLATAIARYEKLLRMAGIGDEQVASTYPTRPVARFAAGQTLMLLLELPLAVVGVVLNWLPYKIPGWVTSWARVPRNVQASYKVLVSLVIFPLTWLAEAWLAGRFFPFPSAPLAMGILAPFSGWIALRFSERFETMRSEGRAYLRLRPGTSLARELEPMRRDILRELSELGREASTHPSERAEPPQE